MQGKWEDWKTEKGEDKGGPRGNDTAERASVTAQSMQCRGILTRPGIRKNREHGHPPPNGTNGSSSWHRTTIAWHCWVTSVASYAWLPRAQAVDRLPGSVAM